MKIPEEWFKSNPFVYACATGNLEEVKARINAGEDINQIAHDARYVGGKLSGVGAAMATHSLDVLDELIAQGADITKTYRNDILDGYHTAFDTAINSFFWQGVDRLINHHGIPLITIRENKDELLFSALPRPTHIHSFGPHSDPAQISEARRLDEQDRDNGLATIDYLIDELGLSVDTEIGGMTLLSSANCHADFHFWGDRGATLKHLLARGCDPNLGATQTEPRFSVAITEEAREDLDDIFGTNAAGDVEGDLIIGGPDTLHTSGLIGACYRPDPKIIEIYMNDVRSDPLHYDKHGNNAFDMLHVTPLDDDRTRENVSIVSGMLKSQVKRIYGYDLYDVGFAGKDTQPN